MRYITRATAVLLLLFVFATPLLSSAQGTNLGGSATGTNLGGSNTGTNLGGSDEGTNLGGNDNNSSGCTSSNCLKNPLNGINSLTDLLDALIVAVVRIGTIVLVLALVYVGFLFVAAQGNEEKIRSARSALMWTVIGGLVLLGAQAISTVIKATVSGL